MFPDRQPDRPSLLNRQIKHRALLGSHRNNILLKKVTMMGYQELPLTTVNLRRIRKRV